MRFGVIASCATALLLASAGASLAGPDAGAARCAPGSVRATIDGKTACLRAGAACITRHDRAYHRYRFHCHGGRLMRFPAPPPPPPPPPPPAPPRVPDPPPAIPDPPPGGGELVDIGGYRLMLECVGSAAPTVVIVPGAGGSRWGWRGIQYALGSEMRVCSYDRPGAEFGSSDPRPAGIAPTSETYVRELRTLLANGNVPGPYVLATGSFGGIIVGAFLAHHPELVSGLVFIDAFAPGSAHAFVNGAPSEHWDGRADVERLRTLSFGPRPVVVLATTYTGEIPDFRRRANNMIAAEATQYGHVVTREAPGLVYETIRVAVSGVRAGGALPRCADTPLARLVQSCTP